MRRSVAIVGAGAAGTAAAYAIRDDPVDVTLFEKSDGVCGRAATRRKDDCTYEYGANYLKDDDERVSRVVTEELSTEGLVDVTDPVWVFDGQGAISEGRDEDETKWTYERGISQLSKRLLDRTDATVRENTRIETMDRVDGGWRFVDSEREDHGTYDAAVLTPPAPQTADLLGQSDWQHVDCRTLREGIATIPYRAIVSGVFHYDFEFDRPYYALVNEDENHEIGWLAREECKPGHVLDGESVLLVQMAPDWSAEHFHESRATVVDSIKDATAVLLDDDRISRPDWTDHQHWRYALPDDGADDETLAVGADHDLFFAGDWVAGDARLHAAVRSGLETGEAVGNHL